MIAESMLANPHEWTFDDRYLYIQNRQVKVWTHLKLVGLYEPVKKEFTPRERELLWAIIVKQFGDPEPRRLALDVVTNRRALEDLFKPR